MREPSGWTITPQQWRYAPESGQDDFDWLRFARPIDDALGYNQGVPQVDPHAVHDWIVTLDIALLQGTLAVELTSPNQSLRLEINAGRREAKLWRDDECLATRPLPVWGSQPRQLVIGNLDRQAICELAGRLLFNEPIAEIAVGAEREPGIAIGARGGIVTLDRIRIDRDVYYSQPRGLVAASYQLGADEYLLLGDNPALSHDSRYWQPPGISIRQFVGAPIVVSRRGASNP